MEINRQRRHRATAVAVGHIGAGIEFANVVLALGDPRVDFAGAREFGKFQLNAVRPYGAVLECADTLVVTGLNGQFQVGHGPSAGPSISSG